MTMTDTFNSADTVFGIKGLSSKSHSAYHKKGEIMKKSG
jgi:hypothetical protein